MCVWGAPVGARACGCVRSDRLAASNADSVRPNLLRRVLTACPCLPAFLAVFCPRRDRDYGDYRKGGHRERRQ